MSCNVIHVALLAMLCVGNVAAQESVPANTAAIPAAERAVLLELYRSTNGEDWKHREGWGGPAGTECEWYGVICDNSDDGQLRVSGLYLGDNRLSGILPARLGELAGLSELLLYGNRLSGAVPASVLNRFDDGWLRFLGYAGQFSPIVEIRLSVRPTGVICGDYDVTLKVGGPDTVARKLCRNATAEDRSTFWERSSGRTGVYAGDIDRIARLVEATGFASLLASYRRSITHGTSETITVIYRNGTRRAVEDYAESAPAPMWLMKRAIAGAAFGGDWEHTTRTDPVVE